MRIQATRVGHPLFRRALGLLPEKHFDHDDARRTRRPNADDHPDAHRHAHSRRRHAEPDAVGGQGPVFPVNLTATGNQSAPSIAVREVTSVSSSSGPTTSRMATASACSGGDTTGSGCPSRTSSRSTRTRPATSATPRSAPTITGTSWSSGRAPIPALRRSSRAASTRTGLRPVPSFWSTRTRPVTRPSPTSQWTPSFMVVWSSAPAGRGAGHDGSGSGSSGSGISPMGRPTGQSSGQYLYERASSLRQRSAGPTFGIVVVWRSEGQDGSTRWRLRSALGNGGPEGVEFQVNSSSSGDQTTPDVAVSHTGTLVTWATEVSTAPTRESPEGFSAQTLGAGVPGQHATPPDVQRHPRAAANSFWSDFIVVWESVGQDDPADPARDLRSTLSESSRSLRQACPPYLPRRGSEYQINTSPAAASVLRRSSSTSPGQFVVAWASEGQDGDGAGVFARRFGSPDRCSPGRCAAERRRLQRQRRAGARRTRHDGPDLVGSLLRCPPARGNGVEPDRTVRPDLHDRRRERGLRKRRVLRKRLFHGRPETATKSRSGPAPGRRLTGMRRSTRRCPRLRARSALEPDQDLGAPRRAELRRRSPGQFLSLHREHPSQPRHRGRRLRRGELLRRGRRPPPADGGLRAQGHVRRGLRSAAGHGSRLRRRPGLEPVRALDRGARPPGSRRGLCGSPAAGPPSYCPTGAVNRQQMAVFLVKATNTDVLSLRGIFADVPCDSPSLPTSNTCGERASARDAGSIRYSSTARPIRPDASRWRCFS